MKMEKIIGNTISSQNFGGLLAPCMGIGMALSSYGEQPNILLFTVDDMNYQSISALGCPVPETTPNLDKFLGESVYFYHAHVATSICTPSRSCMLTGRYPLRNGGYGFVRIRDDVSTLPDLLHSNGYYTAISGKGTINNSGVFFKGHWDHALNHHPDFDCARNKALFYKNVRYVADESKKRGKPFFYMLNSTDPHRPFAWGDKTEADWVKAVSSMPSRIYTPEEITVPDFLPDTPGMRHDLAGYYSSVRRLDDSFGEAMRALKDAGIEEDTLVVFLSDNGMPFPFAKCTDYNNGTRTPLIVRWPGHILSGIRDNKHLINEVDLTPTFLEIAGIPAPPDIDGQSFLPLLKGNPPVKDRKFTFAEHNPSHSQKHFVRAAIGTQYVYIFNPFYNGKPVYTYADCFSPVWWPEVQAEMKTNVMLKARFDFYRTRDVEEFYNTQADPDCLHNLINNPEEKGVVAESREALRDHLEQTSDPVLSAVDIRNDPGALKQFQNTVQEEWYITAQDEERVTQEWMKMTYVTHWTEKSKDIFAVHLTVARPCIVKVWAPGSVLMLEKSFEALDHFDVDLGALPSGNYNFTIHFPDQVVTHKIWRL